jgi:dimethylamine monooxygenase subunit A
MAREAKERYHDPAHMPWLSGHTPFTIGLRRLDLDDWIETDDRLCEYLAEKRHLKSEIGEKVYAAEPDTEQAQREILALLVKYLPDRFPDIYKREGNHVRIVPCGYAVALEDWRRRPLQVAAMLVQEDLVIMRQSPAGWRLVAASLCFPSNWRLIEKFGLPLQEIHNPVPAFGEGTRNAAIINRIFDNLRPEQPVWRANWSLYPDDMLYHGDSKKDGVAAQNIDEQTEIFIRTEYQTLRKLAVSGDILFTIRIHVDPLGFMVAHPDRRELAMALQHCVMSLDSEQLAYKGRANTRMQVIGKLEQMAGSGERLHK